MVGSRFVAVNGAKFEEFDGEIRCKLGASVGDNIGGESMEFEYMLDIEFRRFFSGDVCGCGTEVCHLGESVHTDKDGIVAARGR
jgi:hypothetical protein